MAFCVATGAGGVALTVWALRASGLSARSVARRVLAFEFFLYGVYAGTLVVVGVGLSSGLFAGSAPWTLTVAPAILGTALIAALLSMRALPDDFDRRMKPLAGARRGRRLLARLASAPWAVHDALGIAFSLTRRPLPVELFAARLDGAAALLRRRDRLLGVGARSDRGQPWNVLRAAGDPRYRRPPKCIRSRLGAILRAAAYRRT